MAIRKGILSELEIAEVFNRASKNTKTGKVEIGKISKGEFPAKYYPENGGAIGKWEPFMAEEGMVFDRYGDPKGSYFSDLNTPFEMRALPPSTNPSDYLRIEILKPFSMERSLISPWFGQPGLGTQYRTPISLRQLEELKFIKFH